MTAFYRYFPILIENHTKTNMKFRTLSVHGAYHPDKLTDAVPPLHFSTTFEHRSDSSLLYSRVQNPNREMLEKLVAKLENGKHGFAFSSGVAAINAVLQMLPVGSTIVAPKELYHGARILMNNLQEWKNFNLHYVDLSLNASFAELSSLKPDLIWIETPSNPNFTVSDVRLLCEWAKNNKCLSAVDSTWMSPVYMNPLKLGADFVIHSATKYLSGHSDVLAGIVVVKDDDLATKIRNIQISQGAVLDPFDCWMIIRSIKTLEIRVKAQSFTAGKLAHWLKDQSWIEEVLYPGLYSGNEGVVHRHQTSGNGSMISFLVKAPMETVREFASKTQMIINATSLGGVESTWEHRFSSEGVNSPTPKNLIRFSVGLEDQEDLMMDISQAAKAVGLI
jgi:cystathionine gamma-synthase